MYEAVADSATSIRRRGHHMAAHDAATLAMASCNFEKPANMTARVPPPAAWLQRLVNDEQLMWSRELSALMAASWDMCEAVLRVMDQWRLKIEVRARAGRYG
jgi:hypothetical protein